MKIYIEQSANDKVSIEDWGSDISAPANTDTVDNVEGFDDMFELDQRLRYDAGGSRWDGMDDNEIPYYENTDYVEMFEGRTLVYYKSNGIVTWDNVIFKGSIELTTSADEIDADGTSTCTITIKKKDYQENYCTNAEDDDTIKLSLTRGSLSALSIDLVNGVATVILTSVSETVSTKILAEADNLENDAITIQFTPVT